jgi:hypothetical protein
VTKREIRALHVSENSFCRSHGDFSFLPERFATEDFVSAQTVEPNAGRAMAPRQHARRFARRSRLQEAAQVGPITLRRSKVGALVAQSLARRFEEMMLSGRFGEQPEGIGDSRRAMREAEEMGLIRRPERVPGPASFGSRCKADQMRSVTARRFDEVLALEALRRLDKRGNEARAAVDNVHALRLRRQFGADQQ